MPNFALIGQESPKVQNCVKIMVFRYAQVTLYTSQNEVWPPLQHTMGPLSHANFSSGLGSGRVQEPPKVDHNCTF